MNNNPSLSSSLPYDNRPLLYVMHFCFAFTARMWDMGIVLLLSELSNNNLSLVAFAGFLTSLFVVLFMGSVGHFLDTTNRLLAAQYALSAKVVAIVLTYSLCAYLSSDSFVGHQIDSRLLYLVPCISALANLSFSTISTSVEKDWIVVLANSDSRWLSITNSRMTQIDSICNAFAPALTGYLFSLFSPSIVAVILLFTNLFSTICLYVFMHYLYFSWDSLSIREQKLSSKKQISEKTALLHSTKDSLNQLDSTEGYLHDFLNSGCAGTMISYAFLYLTVLNFGSLMVVYLRWYHLSDSWIGAGRGAGAVTGLLGATIFPFLADCLGIYRASNLALLFQFILVSIACCSFFLNGSNNEKYGVEILCIAVLLSRTGLWMFDLGVRQIAQETIPEYCRGKVNGQWKSIISFFEMASFLLAAALYGKYKCLFTISFHNIFCEVDPAKFWVLSVISTVMVGAALILFTMTRPDFYQNSLMDDLV